MKKIKKVSLSVVLLKEGSKIIAYSPALDISTCGGSVESAKKRFEELTSIFFEELVEKGTLEDVLLDCGWRRTTKAPKRWIPPLVLNTIEEKVNVPLN